MAAQQIQIAETIRSMKLALKRRPDDSESDSEMRAHTNRGHKLKRQARHVREGRLDTTGGLAYRNRVKHAGYTRTTISTNPPLYDSDGEPYSPVTSDDERYASPIEDDPFGDVKLEQLLKPLTAVHELAEHPSLSVPFKSKALVQMASEALEMLRRERASLWKAKSLLRRFRGDSDWMPLELFETPGDEMLLHEFSGEAVLDGEVVAMGTTQEGAPNAENGESSAAGIALGFQGDGAHFDVEAMNGVEIADMALSAALAEPTAAEPANDAEQSAAAPAMQIDAEESLTERADGQEGHTTDTAPHLTNGEASSHMLPNPTVTDLRRSTERASSESVSNSGSGNTHAMTTRARARSPQPSPLPSPSPSDSASVPAIHPWFQIPPSAIPDRDLGLPPVEAEETRKLLLLYCQKQEQVIRSLQGLYEGIQKAERLKNYVLSSAKAGGHLVSDGKGNMATGMSDGEDWYDAEEFGALEKGKDEVEDVEEEARRGVRRRRVHAKVM